MEIDNLFSNPKGIGKKKIKIPNNIMNKIKEVKMKRYVSQLNEGINDKYIFKAVFLAGGPGSGKSYVSNLMFGKEIDKYVSPFGVKVVNSDIFFEKKLEQHSLPSIINIKNEDIYERQMALRDVAKQLTTSLMGHYIDGMLPIIIDGTGKDYEKIKGQAEVLKSFGYDVSMVFINTSLEVAQQRNQMRPRKVDPALVEKMWLGVQKNIGKFQQYFGGNNFIVIDANTHKKEGTPEAVKFSNLLFKMGQKLLNKPLENIIGKRIIDNLLQTGGKYLHDLDIKTKNGFKV